MYEKNNFLEEPIVIGIDHGFSLMKTRNHIFSNGVTKCNGRPPIAENCLYFENNYYVIGGNRKTVVEDKTADEDFFILTLAAIAKELKSRGEKNESNIVLGVGVPFKRFGMEQGKLISYLHRKGEIYFAYEDVDYLISIQNVFCFPQCFAAIADRLGNMTGRYVIADIGSWTKDVICIEDRKVMVDECVTIPNSIITLFRDINDAVMEATGKRIPERTIQDFIMGKKVVFPYEVDKIIVGSLINFAKDIEGMLEESGFDLDYSNIIYVGGGARIMRDYGSARNNVAYLEDIRLNAKGYEMLANHQMNKSR